MTYLKTFLKDFITKEESHHPDDRATLQGSRDMLKYHNWTLITNYQLITYVRKREEWTFYITICHFTPIFSGEIASNDMFENQVCNNY